MDLEIGTARDLYGQEDKNTRVRGPEVIAWGDSSAEIAKIMGFSVGTPFA
jgi:hypothetical protein